MQSASRSAAITAELRDEILRGQYRCGERLPSERDLAERFAVHRGAVREALKRLEQLGLAHIRPGGARVAPLDEASLDVVEHLLGLEDPPDPAIVDQVLEMMGGMFTMSARLCAERATDEQRAGVLDVLQRLADAEGDIAERVQLIDELGDRMVEATGNIVMKIARRQVKAHFLERVNPRGLDIRNPSWVTRDHLLRVAAAIEARDGPAASEAIYDLTKSVRRNAVRTIEELRQQMAAAESEAS
jgi:DNA-binding FadR family transcriptional regulator